METELPTTNPRVRLQPLEVLSDSWYVLRRATFDFLGRDGQWTTQRREAYDRGNGVTILLHDPDRDTVVLTRQFRVPAYLNGHPDGMLIETPAGLVDEGEADDVSSAIRRELAEETGYHVSHVELVFDLFMSPGSVTERVAHFIARYRPEDKVERGGGVDDEGEDIEVLEMTLDEALAMVERGEIADAKTVLLLQWLKIHRLRNTKI